MKKLKSVLLVDDNIVDNRFHQIIIQKTGLVDTIHFAENGLEAIDFLTKDNNPVPELILLDINMPKSNGWEFLESYKSLSLEQKSKVVIIMLTTSLNPEDRRKAEANPDVTGFIVKPLSQAALQEIIATNFPDNMV